MEKDPITRLVEGRHDAYEAEAPEWRFFRQTIEGGPAYVEGNLFKYAREDATIYAERKKRAADHRFNVSGLVLDAYEGYLGQTPPTPAPDLPECIIEFHAHADEEGTPAAEFTKHIAHWMMGNGIVWVGVDKPAISSDQKMSAQQEKEARIAPYAYLVQPTHVLDGRIHRGVVEWLLIQEDSRDDKNPWNSSRKTVTRYRLWEPHQWTLFEEIEDPKDGPKYRQVEQGPNLLGEVPFVPFRCGEGTGFTSPGLLKDIAHLDRGIFNKASQLDEIHYQVTFPQLRYPYRGDVGESEAGRVLTMGLHSVLPYDIGVSSSLGSGPNNPGPDYIAPSSEPAQEIRRGILERIAQALALALLDGEVGAPSGEETGQAKASPSGVSKAYTFDKLNKRLSAIADVLEANWAKVVRLVALWQKADASKLPAVPLDWPDTFEVRSLPQEIQDVIALLGVGVPSPTFIQQLQKAIVRKALPKADAETIKAIDAEIEAGENAAYDVGGAEPEDEEDTNESRPDGAAGGKDDQQQH